MNPVMNQKLYHLPLNVGLRLRHQHWVVAEVVVGAGGVVEDVAVNEY